MPYAHGSCSACGQRPMVGRSRCAACAEAARKRAAAERARKRKVGECLRSGCSAPVAAEVSVPTGIGSREFRRVARRAAYCTACLQYYATREARRRARNRPEER